MKIGEVIRKYRKEKNMTQEEMANRLGVTAPAVNKWENGNTMPDILLLAPIARLLDISLDTLLSFRVELTDKEINEMLEEVNERFDTEEFEEVFQWIKGKMEEYPNCERLLLWMAVTIEGNRLARKVPDAEKYDDFLEHILTGLLESKEEYVRTTAADALYNFYKRKGAYEKAEECLEYFSIQNPERKRKKAALCEVAGRVEEAYKAYEEILWAEYQILNMVFYSMISMRIKEENYEKAEYLSEKRKQLARLFEMGEYNEYALEVDLLAAKKDVEGTLKCAERLLSGVDEIASFGKAPLYEHMVCKEIEPEFIQRLKEELKKNFREDVFDYMKEDERWETLLK